VAVHDVQDIYDVPPRHLFGAQTPIGRIGNLINAVSVFDVYFAMDVHRRFALEPNGRRSAPATGLAALLDAHATHIDAIDPARHRWTGLRGTRPPPAATAAPLAPPYPTKQRRRRHPGEAGPRVTASSER